MFKYISKTHLILLAIIIVIFGTMLLLGEHYATLKPTANTSTPVSPVGTSEESMLYGLSEPQSQLATSMRSDSFVIRPGESRLTYTQAVELYENDTLQFNQDCQLSTVNHSFHLNNEIMIDNRSSKANIFTVGDSLVAIGPYDFAFMILKDKGSNIPVGCGDNKKVATITVQ